MSSSDLQLHMVLQMFTGISGIFARLEDCSSVNVGPQGHLGMVMVQRRWGRRADDNLGRCLWRKSVQNVTRKTSSASI